MLRYKKANLIEQHGVIIHGVNARGVMGSGVAKDIRIAFPEAFHKYLEAYSSGFLELGSISFVTLANGVVVVNACTQNFYGYDGAMYVNYDAVRNCLAAVKLTFPEGPYFLPKIGCGLGGGDWNVVSKIIEETLGEATICIKE